MKKSYFIAFVITIVALLWIGSGFIAPTPSAEKAEAQEQSEEKKPEVTKVQTQVISAQPYTKKITVNGRSEASKDVIIRAEAEGQIVEVLHEEGDVIAKGTKIVKIDVRERKERVREARELVKQRKIEYDAARKLIKQGFASDVRVAQTQSAYESALAGFKRAEIDLEKTTVMAPFDGVLGQRHVDVGDYVSIGDEITAIVDLDPLEVVAFVNEKEIVQLKKGNEAILRFVGGEMRTGIVDYIAPAADEDKRTFRVTIVMDNPEGEVQLPAGLTAQVDIDVKSKEAYKIPPSILTLNDTGSVGVKTVGNDNKVDFVRVDIVEDAPDHLWVTGLEGAARVVMVGQDFIVPDQVVEAVEKRE